MCKKPKKRKNGINIAITIPRKPTPSHVKNNIATVFVKKLIPVKPSEYILPRCVTTYKPTTRCNKLTKIGASTPSKM